MYATGSGEPARNGFESLAAEFDGLRKRFFWKAKALGDRVAAAMLIILCAPLLVLAALAVAATLGPPVFFWQKRPGRGGLPFRVYKFRTMGNVLSRDGKQLSDHERCSGAGNLLRRLRLDELPQLFNILRGEMSFVGPRPLLPKDQSQAFGARLLVRPGLTGWAQVAGGRQTSADDKSALDIWYVNNASFKLDIEILLRTILVVLFGERVSAPLIERAWEDLRKNGAAGGSIGPNLEGGLWLSPSHV